MEITFDPVKDATNIQRRGLSLALAGEIDWGFAYEWQDKRKDYGEVRMVALAPIGERLFCVAYVDRPADAATERRIISLRKANLREMRLYEANY
jgi:uncharacterized DUF497 family protein